MSSGIGCCVFGRVVPDILGLLDPWGWRNYNPLNRISPLVLDAMAHARRHKSSESLLWECQVLHNVVKFNVPSCTGHSCVYANRTVPLHCSLQRRMATLRYSCSYCHKEPIQTPGVQMVPLHCGSQHKWDTIMWWGSCWRPVPVLMLDAM